MSWNKIRASIKRRNGEVLLRDRRGAPQRSKTRSSQIEEASSRKSKSQAPFSKGRFPFSKSHSFSQKLGLLRITRRSNCPDVSSLVTCSLELCENHEPNPDLNPGFQKINLSRRVVTRNLHRQLCGNYGPLCQKARNWYCSSIRRLPTNSRGIVPVVKRSSISFDLCLPQQRHTLSISLHLRECIPKETFRVTQCPSSLGAPQKTNHPEQKYFISRRLKAKVSHITLSPHLHLKNMEKVRS